MTSKSMRGCLLLFVLGAAACSEAKGKGAESDGRKKLAAATSATTSSSAWYDAKPLLASIRPSARADLLTQIGVASLEELPLYDLDLGLDVDAGKMTLVEDVYFTNRESAPLDEVVLRVYANSIAKGAKAPVDFLKGACTSGATCTVANDGPSTLVVTPSKPIAPGGRVVVHLELKGTLEEIDSSRTNMLMQGIEQIGMLGGGGELDVKLLTRGDGICSLANFYPVLARRYGGAWEKKDDGTLGDLGSDDLANVKARVTLDKDAKLASTGVTLSDTAKGADHVVEIGAAAVRDFAAMASKDFVVGTKKVGDVEVRSFSLKDEKSKGDAVLDTAAWAVDDYEKRFGPYAYQDLDVVESPLVGGVGGVEFSGLVTIASMLYRPMLPGALGSLLGGGALGGGGMLDSMLDFVTAHEVAHQWWHGLVGSDSRAHPFVDEGLAQWTAMQYLEDRYGHAKAEEVGAMQVAMNYKMMRMLGNEDAAVDRPAKDFAGALDYAGLVYGKGPYVYAEIEKAIGEKAFFDGVRSYVSKYRFKIAPKRGLVDELAATVGAADAAKVKSIATRWLDEAHGDEDLGSASFTDLLGPMLGGVGGKGGGLGLGGGMDPMIEEMMKGLLDEGSAGSGGGGGALPDLGDDDDEDEP